MFFWCFKKAASFSPKKKSQNTCGQNRTCVNLRLRLGMTNKGKKPNQGPITTLNSSSQQCRLLPEIQLLEIPRLPEGDLFQFPLRPSKRHAGMKRWQARRRGTRFPPARVAC